MRIIKKKKWDCEWEGDLYRHRGFLWRTKRLPQSWRYTEANFWEFRSLTLWDSRRQELQAKGSSCPGACTQHTALQQSSMALPDTHFFFNGPRNTRMNVGVGRRKGHMTTGWNTQMYQHSNQPAGLHQEVVARKRALEPTWDVTADRFSYAVQAYLGCSARSPAFCRLDFETARRWMEWIW